MGHYETECTNLIEKTKNPCYIMAIFAFIRQSIGQMADILTETYQRIRLRLRAGARQLLSDTEAAEDAQQDASPPLWFKPGQGPQNHTFNLGGIIRL